MAIGIFAWTVLSAAQAGPPAGALPQPEIGRPIAPLEPGEPVRRTPGHEVPDSAPASRPVGILRPEVGRPLAPAGPAGRPGRGAAGQTADTIFVGRLLGVKEGPVAMSYPPIYSFTLTFEVKDVLRGEMDKAPPVSLGHRVAAENPPQFAQGGDYLVFAKRDARQGLQVVDLKAADEAAVKAARLAASLPVGWTAEDGKVVSPWVALGAAAWPEGVKGPEVLAACSKTGRPAFLAGKGVRLEVQPVPPAKSIQWTNPDGDGEYTVTLTNTTDKAVDVPALLSDEGGIRWDQSLLIGCQGRFQPALAVVPLKAVPKPTRIEPGKSVSTTASAFRLTGVNWPQGGYRIEFTFCLGELAASHSFYYVTRHHDPIRKRVLKEAGITDTPASRPAAPTRELNVPGLSREDDP